MDAYLKKEQNGTLFVWMGPRGGGYRGEGGQGGPAQNLDPPSNSFFFNLPGLSQKKELKKLCVLWVSFPTFACQYTMLASRGVRYPWGHTVVSVNSSV